MAVAYHRSPYETLERVTNGRRQVVYCIAVRPATKWRRRLAALRLFLRIRTLPADTREFFWRPT